MIMPHAGNRGSRAAAWVRCALVATVLHGAGEAVAQEGPDRARNLALPGSIAVEAGSPFADAPPADTLYLRGRQALNRGNHEEAARLFERLRTEQADSEHLGSAHYYEAVARMRIGSEAELQAARRLLVEYERRFGSSGGAGDAQSLLREVESGLAELSGNCPREELEPRVTALSALARGVAGGPDGDPDALLDLFREILRSDDPCHRAMHEHVVSHAALLGTRASVELIAEVVRGAPEMDLAVRRNALGVLGHSEHEAALSLLVEVLRDPGATELHERALATLSRSPLPGAREVIREVAASSDTPEDLRVVAVTVLARPQSSSVWQSYGLSGNLSHTLRTMEVARLAGVYSGPGLAFGSPIAPEDRDFLIDLYRRTRSDAVREQIVNSLGAQARSEDGAVVQFLLEVARTDASAELRRRAVLLLAASSDPRAQEFLTEIVRSGVPR